MRRVLAPAALCAWLWLGGCGGEPEPAATVEGSSAPEAASSSNSRPVIESVALEPSRPRPGENVRARVVASDPDGDPIRLEYVWRVGGRTLDTDRSQAAIRVEGASRESAIEVTVVAHDDHGESAPETAVARVGNLPPTIVAVGWQPEGKVSAGTAITAMPHGSDPEGGQLEYTYRWSVNGETRPVEGPTLPGDQFERGDTIVLEVTASDGSAESETVVSPPIPVGNAAPRVVSEPGQFSADGVFRYTLKTEDPDGDTAFRYTLVKGPTGMSIGFDDGKLIWEPAADAAGSHEIEIEVADRFGGKSDYRFSLQLSYETETAPAAAEAPTRRLRRPAPAAQPES
jgi:hypothetical protein